MRNRSGQRTWHPRWNKRQKRTTYSRIKRGIKKQRYQQYKKTNMSRR